MYDVWDHVQSKASFEGGKKSKGKISIKGCNGNKLASKLASLYLDADPLSFFLAAAMTRAVCTHTVGVVPAPPCINAQYTVWTMRAHTKRHWRKGRTGQRQNSNTISTSLCTPGSFTTLSSEGFVCFGRAGRGGAVIFAGNGQ